MNCSFASSEKTADPRFRTWQKRFAFEQGKAVASQVHQAPVTAQTAGNLATQRLLRSSMIQAKLTIHPPSDRYEHEADHVADQVMRRPDPTVQRSCAACESGDAPCPKCAAEKAMVRQRKELTAPRCALDEVCETDESVAYRGNLGNAACDFHSGQMKSLVQKEHCAGNCVAQHEAQHSQDLGQCCTGYARCIATAGDTKNRCHDNWNDYFRRVEYWTECNAYSREYGCLRNLFLDQCSFKSERVDKECCDTLQKEIAGVEGRIATYCADAFPWPCPFDDKGEIRKM